MPKRKKNTHPVSSINLLRTEMLTASNNPYYSQCFHALVYIYLQICRTFAPFFSLSNVFVFFYLAFMHIFIHLEHWNKDLLFRKKSFAYIVFYFALALQYRIWKVYVCFVSLISNKCARIHYGCRHFLLICSTATESW